MSRLVHLAVSTALASAACTVALASSHREAPFTAANPTIDGTDFYMFRAYGDASTNAAAVATDSVVFIANYNPLQDPYGGPNYFALNPNALYAINIDNNGDAKAEISFQFQFTNNYKGAGLNTGATDANGNAVKVPIPLIVAAPLGTTGDNSTDAGANRYETYTVNMVQGTTVTPLKTAGGSTTFQKPVDNIGTKTIPNYNAYANNFIQTVSFGSCGTGQIFVGQRREGFIIDLGETFDLLDLNPLGGRNSTQNTLAGKSITSIVMQVPVACLTKDGKGSAMTADPVLGAWTTAYLRQARVLNPIPQSTNNYEVVGGAWTQVSRLGQPLVNELVIGLPDKDRFNDSQPKDDAQFATYVTNPTLPVLINALFPATMVPATPRADLVATFLTGLSLKATGGTTPVFSNNPSDYGDTVVASEELRLNTSVAPVATTAQNNLGLLACDTAGYPNGRRPADDVVDIELTAAEGALTTANPNGLQTCNVSSGTPTVANANAVVNDGAAADATDANYYLPAFPYLAPPLPGAPNAARAATASQPTSTGTAAGGDTR
ncbi:MAG TPA: DUF4331 domain-containing protein [Steroidobacteraceae bacterium]|nr:DUF4331 domain-containing protein [Steroidobacteraceae bacterium]